MEDYVRILEDLKNRRDAIEETIKAIEKMLAADGGRRTLAPAGLYTGMTVIEAAKKYLSIVKRPASTKEICEALEKGGIEHKAKDFYSSVYAILRQRAQSQGDIQRDAMDWKLVEDPKEVAG